MIKLFKRMKNSDKAMLLSSVIFIVLQVYFDMRIPELLSAALKVANNEELSLEEGASQIRSVAAIMAGYVCVSFLLSAVSSMIIAWAVMSFVTGIRRDIFHKVQLLSIPDVDGFTVSGLITRSTSDVMNVQTFILIGFQAIIKAPVISVWALAKIGAYGRSWQLTVIIGIAFVVLLIAAAIIIEAPQIRKAQKNKDSLNKSVMEKLGGVDVVRAYNAQGHLRSKFEGINKKLTKAMTISQLPSAVVIPGINLVLYVVTIVIYILAVYQINSGYVENQLDVVTDIVAFIPYTAQLLLAFIFVVQVMMLYQGARVSSSRIAEVLDSRISVEDTGSDNTRADDNDETPALEFRDVSFGYNNPENCFLNNISFKCSKGSTTAIIGAIGSGKTTIIDLLMRFYDVNKGEILLGGVNIKDYSLHELRDQISLTAQKALLFTGSIEENVRLGNNGNDSPYDLEKTCEIAGAAEFIEGQEEQYQAPVLKRGTNFSGGQRQRLSIARCLSKPCKVMIFDDSFSALDYKTEKKVRKMIMEKFSGVTKIIVSQRISTIVDADQILVMNNGAIVGCGSHEMLLETCRDYQEIYASQHKDDDIASGSVKEESYA